MSKQQTEILFNVSENYAYESRKTYFVLKFLKHKFALTLDSKFRTKYLIRGWDVEHVYVYSMSLYDCDKNLKLELEYNTLLRVHTLNNCKFVKVVLSLLILNVLVHLNEFLKYDLSMFRREICFTLYICIFMCIHKCKIVCFKIIHSSTNILNI